MRIGVAGLGVVAQGLLELLRKASKDLVELSGQRLFVTNVASRTLRKDVDLTEITFSPDVLSLVSDPKIDVVVELIGGTDTALTLIQNALDAGKGVVTANKAVIADHGNELIELAHQRGVPFCFEAAVAGGIPIIAALKSDFPANRVNAITGIINGTCNYILSAMYQEGASFDDALTSAQQLGYAEADPSFDVGGQDAAQKLAILAAMAFDTDIQYEAVAIEGIQDIADDDIRHARDLGYTIKHLALARKVEHRVEMRVHATLVHDSNLLAKVQGVENVVQLETESAGNLRFLGPGAGGAATASAVVSDLVTIAKGLYRPPRIGNQSVAITAAGEITSAYYLNISAVDQPGVIASVGNVLALHGISIASMIQKKEEARELAEGVVIPVILLTSEVNARELQIAIDELEKLREIKGPIKKIRAI